MFQDRTCLPFVEAMSQNGGTAYKVKDYAGICTSECRQTLQAATDLAKKTLDECSARPYSQFWNRGHGRARPPVLNCCCHCEPAFPMGHARASAPQSVVTLGLIVAQQETFCFTNDAGKYCGSFFYGVRAASFRWMGGF